MDNLIVTRHAMDRYRDLVADVSDREIFARLSGPTFELAARLGAPFVKLPSGHHAVIRCASVITVLEPQSCRLLFDRGVNPLPDCTPADHQPRSQ